MLNNIVGLILLVLIFQGCKPKEDHVPTDKEINDAYTYMLGRYIVLRQENNDINVEKVGYNKIKYNPLGSAQFVNPNMDVAYLECWLAVDSSHAVILNVPEVKDRYYTAQLLDGWGEVITNINERNYPDHPFGKFALVIKGTNPPNIGDAVKIELPSAKAKMLARVELKGSPQEAVKLQQAFTLNVPEGIKIDPPVKVPEFTNAKLIGAAIFDKPDAILNSYPDPMPEAARYQALTKRVAAYMLTSDSAAAHVEEVVQKQAIPAFMEGAKGFGTQKGGWSVSYVAGKFGNDIMARDIINYGGLWANVITEAIYFVGLTDSGKQLLHGDNVYEIRFPKGEWPDAAVNAFWSVTLYSVPDYHVVNNSLMRYSINNVSGLKPNPDGSKSIWLGSTKPPGSDDVNWLPTPAGKGFALTFRMYVSKPEVLDGKWFPAPIQKK
ncbi:DUF1214 domain-containing protein [Chitinophaga sp. ARDCPP14]|uniref:DUF1214 domain-containing protein n=1 Tax=Chitinophaga sp. ARDCPP14 TaxID=3391139 RepID=UPI003F51E160